MKKKSKKSVRNFNVSIIGKTTMNSVRNPNDSTMRPVNSALQTQSQAADRTKTYSQKILSANDIKSISFTTYFRQYEIIRRNQFTSHWDFLVSCLGATIGFGNIWRFPGLAFIHGGGAFFVPYITCTILVGLPFVSLEMFIGQLSGVGIARTFGLIAPLFAGVGWGMIVLSFFMSLQYSMTLAYCVLYFFASFQNKLAWANCGNKWNTQFCYSIEDAEQCFKSLNCTNDMEGNLSTIRVLPTEEYLYNYILEYKPPEADRNSVSFNLAFPLFGTWLAVFAILAFGLKISSKVTYVTVVFPYLGLVTLFFQSITLDGAGEGILRFFKPDFELLFKNSHMWIDALLHTIYSLNTGFGSLTAMASYNPFHNNCQRHAFIVVVVDFFTCVLAGVVMFAGVGHMAHVLRIPMQNITTNDYALGFVVFPEIISSMQGASFWAILFFIIQIALGLDGLLWLTETVLTEFSDVYQPFRDGKRRAILVGVVCTISFLIGIGFCLKGPGILIMLVLNLHTSGPCLVLLALMENFIVIYIYGYDRLANDIALILGYKPSWYYRVTWMLTAPVFTFALLISMLAIYIPSSFQGLQLPPSSEQFGWLLSSVPIACIFIFAVYRIIKNFFRKKPFYACVLPRKRWCPRKKSNLALQKAEIENAEKGLMAEYSLVAGLSKFQNDSKLQSTNSMMLKSKKSLKLTKKSPLALVKE